VQNEYLREVRRVGGKDRPVDDETVGTAGKDPWKEMQKKVVANTRSEMHCGHFVAPRFLDPQWGAFALELRRLGLLYALFQTTY